MFGNSLGWAISIGLALLTIWSVGWLKDHAEVTPPTAFAQNAQNLAALVFPEPGRPIVAATIPADSTDLYRKAISRFQEPQDRHACINFGDSPVGAPPAAMQAILDAAPYTSAQVFSSPIDQLIKYGPPDADLLALHNESTGQGLSNLMLLAGLHLIAEKKPAAGRPYADAVYSLGHKLCLERVRYEEFSKGLAMMTGALELLAKCEAPDSDALKNITHYHTDLKSLAGKTAPIWNLIAQPSEKNFAEHGGDLFVIVDEGKEPMWQVEAIMKLGRYKFNSGTRDGDAKAAAAYVAKLADDPKSPPAIRAAARAARDLTLEQFRQSQ